MKKSSIFCILIASLILVTGCKKDQDTVTLSAVINQPSKVFINSDRYPCWEGGDAIYINDNSYSINGNSINNSNRTIAEIQGVTVSSNGYYRAIYPASIVPEGSDILNNTVQVNLPSLQVYEGTNVDNQGYQKIRLPMGAYITSGNTLRFSNLCSVIKVRVNNESGTDDKVIKEIRIDADNTYLSGTGTATVTTSSSSDSDDDNKITITPTGGKKYVKLARSNGGNMKTIAAAGQPADFYIVVPEFSTSDNITITVTTTSGYKKMKFSGVTLNHSSVVTTTIDVSTLKPLPAKLVSGPTFKSIVQPNFEPATSPVTKIKFEYNISTIPNSYTELQTSDSPTPIYGYVSGDTYIVATQADSIMANSDCSQMFRWMLSLTSVDFGSQFNTSSTTSLFQMFYYCPGLTGTLVFPETFYTKSVTRMDEMFFGCENITSITFPEEFNTENVTNMWSMFKDCKELTSINFPTTFNTSRVTTMQAMFDGCLKLTSLDLSTFNTARVTTMYAMFRNCKALTTLTLPSAFNTSSVNTMREMFNSCENLTTLTLPNAFTTANVTTMEAMFKNCKKLTSLDLSLFNTANVVCMSEMFYNCQKMQTITLGTAFTMDAVVANCETYDSDNNLIGRFGRMFAYTGNLLGSNRLCTVYCTDDFQEFIEHDLDGTFHNQHPNIVVANAFWYNNAIRKFCTFVDLPTSK